METYTKVTDAPNSVTVSRDAKGTFRYEVKLYFGHSRDDQHDMIDKAERIVADLRHRFEPALEE